MLDEKKVKLMTHLAFYEQTQGKEDFKISAYYRKDYASLHTICTFLWVTVGYILAVALVILAGLETLMENMSSGVLLMIVGIVFLGYVALIIIYMIISSFLYNEKHKKARQRVKKYNHNLTILLKIYEKENK